MLVAGVLVFVLNRGGGPRPPKPVPLDPRVTAVAREFIRGAVQRRDLAAAYRITALELRRGYSLARWRSGRIPVVPYIGKNVEIAPFAVKLSFPKRAVLSTELSAPASAPAAFRIGLVKRDGRWLVASWTPAKPHQPDG